MPHSTRYDLLDPFVIDQMEIDPTALLPLPEPRITKRERKEFRRLLAKLPDIERLILAAVFKRRTQQEIADGLGLSQGDISYHLDRAKSRLKLFRLFPSPELTEEEVRADLGADERAARFVHAMQFERMATIRRRMGIRSSVPLRPLLRRARPSSRTAAFLATYIEHGLRKAFAFERRDEEALDGAAEG